jgi:hypothetical protein
MDDIMKRLHDSEMFRRVVAAASNDKERSAIIGAAEGMIRQFSGLIGPTYEAAQKDPVAFKKKFSEVAESILNVSGSSPPAT